MKAKTKWLRKTPEMAALITRNVVLNQMMVSLLPRDPEFDEPDMGQLASIEVIAAEILTNLNAMQALMDEQ